MDSRACREAEPDAHLRNVQTRQFLQRQLPANHQRRKSRAGAPWITQVRAATDFRERERMIVLRGDAPGD
jgi:hypothetical protein